MTLAVLIAGLVAGVVGGWRAGRRRGRFDEQFRAARASEMLQAVDAELNALKVKHGETLMQLEDARNAKVPS